MPSFNTFKNCQEKTNNGAITMHKGKGKQAQILARNPEAFFVPAMAQNLNLLYVALRMPTMMICFGIIQGS